MLEREVLGNVAKRSTNQEAPVTLMGIRDGIDVH